LGLSVVDPDSATTPVVIDFARIEDEFARLEGPQFDWLEDPELLSLTNFFITPHMSGRAIEEVLAMSEAAIAGLDNAVDSLAF
jgi:hypothetical protein